jgi:cytochrome P450 family 6
MENGRKAFDFKPIDFMRLFFCGSFPKLGRMLKMGFLPDEPCRFFLKTFLQTLEYREKNKIQRNDLVSMLLGLRDSFTPEELAAESFLVYIGGFESSSTLMTFTMYELALNSEIQDRLRSEILSGLEENDGRLTYDMLFGFKYLDMVINESLRKYPPIPSQARKCTKEYEIPGTKLVIPKGTVLEIPTFSIHRDPEHWPEPDKFEPERFTPEEVKARNPLAFMPFGEGPRNCIGMRFAQMQSKLAIVKIIQNYELSPSDKTTNPISFVPNAPFLAPVGGMHLTLKKIE